MARIDNLTNFLTDVADAIRNKTGNDYPIQPEDYDTEIESISGGGYDGQLPVSSTISRIVQVGNSLYVYVNEDASANGTRIYYAMGSIPTDLSTASYVDKLANESYAVIPNVTVNNIYGIRTASFVIYNTDSKAFNNSYASGVAALKMTTTTNTSGAIMIDLPSDVQGTASSNIFIDYSKYDELIYMIVTNVGFYKLDPFSTNPQWELITNSSSYTYNNTFQCTELGVFFSNHAVCYKVATNTFKTYSELNTNYKYYVCDRLSNGDLLAWARITADISYSLPLLKYNENTDSFEPVGDGNIYTTQLPNIVDNESGIWIIGVDKSNSNYNTLYKYNDSTDTYDKIASFGNTTKYGLSDVYTLLGGRTLIYVRYSEGSSVGERCYVLDTNNSLSLIYTNGYAHSGGHCMESPNSKVIQNPLNLDEIYYITYDNSARLYKADLSTKQSTSIINYWSSPDPYLIVFNNKLFVNSNYYTVTNVVIDLATGTNTSLSGHTYGSYDIVNNNLYYFRGDTVYKYNTTTGAFDSVATGGSSYNGLIKSAVAGNKIIYYVQPKVYVFDSDNNTLTVLHTYSTNANYRFYFYDDLDNYYLRGSFATDGTYDYSTYPQIKINKTTGVCEVLSVTCGNRHIANSVASPINARKAVAYKSEFIQTNAAYVNTQIDTVNKVINGLGKKLLDYTDNYTVVDNPHMGNNVEWDRYHRTLYLINTDLTNVIITFDERSS